MAKNEKHKCESEIIPAGRYGAFHIHKCGKPAKGISSDGKTPMCGIHLAGERRREQNANKGAEERRKEREFADEVRSMLEPLNISGHATGYRHRQLICSFDDLVRAFDKVSSSNEHVEIKSSDRRACLLDVDTTGEIYDDCVLDIGDINGCLHTIDIGGDKTKCKFWKVRP